MGFARVISDYTTFAYLTDVFILAPYRGQGLGKWFIEFILASPQLQGLRSWLLVTTSAQSFYHQLGFKSLTNPEKWMLFSDFQGYPPDLDVD